MAKRTPTLIIRNGSSSDFYEHGSLTEISFQVDSAGSTNWRNWLTDNKSFRVDCSLGRFTARKEPRHGKMYWYAYKKLRGKLYNSYIGKNDITPEVLYEIANYFLSVRQRKSG